MPSCSNENKRLAMQAYIDRMNAGDLAGVVALYADDATIEDPVGSSKLITGKAEITEFYTTSMQTKAQLKLSAPIRTSHSDSAAMAFEVTLDWGGLMSISVIDVMTFNAAGQFTTMRAYWGPEDMRKH
ncbi:MAG: steroid Delta-isomerase [Brachymonas sp.]|jgi:steroid delta-isomerase